MRQQLSSPKQLPCLGLLFFLFNIPYSIPYSFATSAADPPSFILSRQGVNSRNRQGHLHCAMAHIAISEACYTNLEPLSLPLGRESHAFD